MKATPMPYKQFERRQKRRRWGDNPTRGYGARWIVVALFIGLLVGLSL